MTLNFRLILHWIRLLDPHENMNLNELAEEYGDRMTFVGGINTFFFNWSPEEQRSYLDNLFSLVKKGFFLMDSGGIPEHVGINEWNYFNGLKKLLKKEYNR